MKKYLDRSSGVITSRKIMCTNLKLPRWVHKLYAFTHNYFWLPCPLCGKMFGGHEWKDGISIMTSWHDGKGVCPNCTEAAEKYNEVWVKEHPYGRD